MVEIIVGGVDEAGRGSLIGPLVLAGVSIQASRIPSLVEAGVKDSKLLSPSSRSRLYDVIFGLAKKVYVVEVSPKEIDEYVLHGKRLRKLNYLEAKMIAKVVLEIDANVVYVDSPDIMCERFASIIKELIGSNISIVAENYADKRYPIVSAASIIAKVTRDRRIKELEQVYGEIGSGYPSDPRTRAFVKRWLETKGPLPDFVRLSWKSLKKICSKSLDDFK
ncbi:MAG: ribonuclease HII [Nitrososphaeria archaeon]|nr:ribonuclease HII [Nitrososphaeria archaeon]